MLMLVGKLTWEECKDCLNYQNNKCIEDVDYSDLLFVGNRIICELGEEKDELRNQTPKK